MSRLDSMINRLTAQRALLDHAADLVADVAGPVLELGLGNGRTYSHLRERLPDREIFAFERRLAASFHSMPDPDHLILGEIRDTLAYCGPRVGGAAALVHADMSEGDPTGDLARAAWLSPLIAAVAAPGGIVVCGHALQHHGLEPLDLPEGVSEGRYYLYRASG